MLSPPQQPSDDDSKPVSMKHMAHDALHDLLHFDTKILKTVPLLLFKPGKVTERTLAGDQGYVKPFTLFVFINFIFFLIKSKGIFQYTLETYQDHALFRDIIARKLVALGISADVLTERFNIAMRFEQKEYLVIMVPLFALLLACLYSIRRRPFAMHMVFALNFYAWFVLYMALIPLMWLLIALCLKLFHISQSFLVSELFLTLFLLASCFIYLAISIRRVYRDSWWLLVPGLRSSALECSLSSFLSISPSSSSSSCTASANNNHIRRVPPFMAASLSARMG